MEPVIQNNVRSSGAVRSARRTGAIFVALLTAVLVGACGGSEDAEIETHEDAARASIALLEDMVNILEGATDESSAHSAAVFMRSLVVRARSVARQVRALPSMSLEEADELEDMFKGRMQTVVGQLQSVGQNARLDPELYKAYEEMSRAMSEFG
jgi:hypothetical protein